MLQAQKSPLGVNLVGLQDFCGRLWNRREKIWCWRLCRYKYTFLILLVLLKNTIRRWAKARTKVQKSGADNSNFLTKFIKL